MSDLKSQLVSLNFFLKYLIEYRFRFLIDAGYCDTQCKIVIFFFEIPFFIKIFRALLISYFVLAPVEKNIFFTYQAASR